MSDMPRLKCPICPNNHNTTVARPIKVLKKVTTPKKIFQQERKSQNVDKAMATDWQ
jgi:hypothetical protein